jgi:hypothetical protein
MWQDIISWMQWLRWHLGYDGWRFDFAKGYAPSYVLEYIENTQPTFSVGEYWDDCEYDSSFHIKGDQVQLLVCRFIWNGDYCDSYYSVRPSNAYIRLASELRIPYLCLVLCKGQDSKYWGLALEFCR